MYDVLIRNAVIIDGSGNPAYHGDVGINGGSICRIGRLSGGGKEEIDARGRVLSPGFIDVHSHHDLALERDYTCWHALEQGITTLIGGMCGESAAPVSADHLADGARVCGITEEAARGRDTVAGYLARIRQPMGANMGFLIGHGNLRAAVMGYENRQPTPEELARMCALLREGMEAGAMGISFGLIYPPGSYAKTDELTTLCRVAAEYGGLFTVHLRSENTRLVEAVDEMLRVARDSGARCVISHHKATGGRLNWNKTAATLALMDAAVAEGLDVFCDQYPYTASSTGLNTNIPQEMYALGVPRLLSMISDPAQREALRPVICGEKSSHQRFIYTMIGSSASHPEYAGKMLNDIADRQGVDPYDLMLDLLYEDKLTTNGIFHTMSEDDVRRVMRWDRAMFGTDGLFVPGSTGAHPRTFATFPRVLGRYVREKQVITLENALRKMTSLPAMVYGLHKKGLIREGMDADLVLFDPDVILDQADYANPRQRCLGLDMVLVGGQIAVRGGKYTGALAGQQLLRR